MKRSSWLLPALLMLAPALAQPAPAAPNGGPPAGAFGGPGGGPQDDPNAPFPHGPGSLRGLWHSTGILGSATSTVRQRIARDMNGNIPPMQPWAAKLLEQRVSDAEHGKIFANNASACLPQGTPYMLFGAVEGPVQIDEDDDRITFISEEQNEVWFIHLNRKHPPLADIEPTYHGDSIAHWEGNTLVIDTVGISTKTQLDQVGMPHSDALHVIMRVTRTGANTLQFLITIDDPKTFKAPWTRRLIFRKAQPGTEIREYVCEGNENAPDANGFQGFNF